MASIYQIQSIIKPERIYIGSAFKYGVRKARHLWALKKGVHDNVKIQRHYDKYGKEDLVFSVIEEFDFNDRIYVTEREQFYIDIINPFFNINKTANSPVGIPRTPEFGKKISDSKRGKKREPFSQEWRDNMGKRWVGDKNPNFGGITSPTHIENLSKAQLAYLETEEGQAVLKKAHENAVKAHTGSHQKQETKDKIGAKNKIKMEEYSKTEAGIANIEKRANINKGNTYRKGQTTPPEVREKQRVSALLRWEREKLKNSKD